MAPHAVFLILALALPFALADNKTYGVYEYYTNGGIKSGLQAEGGNFTLNGKNIHLYSGSMHYFRVHPAYWRDRLKLMRAAGLLAVETYVPWNLHNPHMGVFDFGQGGDDMSPFLNITLFLKLAKEEDLLVIVRPGPYICAEWEFGGMPSWLLRVPDMKVRSSNAPYETAVRQYFDNLLPILRDHQFTKGGPIIAFQIENEYGNTKEPNKTTDLAHLATLKKMYEDHGLVELFFTSDTPSVGGKDGAVPGVLMTANFNSNPTKELNLLKSWQPDKPSMVMEYWSGWFDHWGEKHHTVDITYFWRTLWEILMFPGHVNFYMFHGGTSFGFMNGANLNNGFPFYAPDISSYEYNAPISEEGYETDKWHYVKWALMNFQTEPIYVPGMFPPSPVVDEYETVISTGVLDWENILRQVPDSAKQTSPQTMYMEFLNVNNNSGQSYGYVAYRTQVKPAGPKIQLVIKDTLKGAAMVMVDGMRRTNPLTKMEDLNGFGYWIAKDSSIDLQVNPNGSTVDIIVENWGRNNFGKLSTDFNEFRGLAPGQVIIDGKPAENWEIFSLEFKGNWMRSLTGWSPIPPNATLSGPMLFNFNLMVKTIAWNPIRDTFVDMRGWGKGAVFVNGFNLGRFCSLGPQRTLYLPGPLLKEGPNQIVVLEHFAPRMDEQGRVALKFADYAIWD